jgi:hypothetical protein
LFVPDIAIDTEKTPSREDVFEIAADEEGT